MSEYTAVEQPYLAQLAAQGWTVIDQGTQLPQGAAPSLRSSFCSSWLPGTWHIRMGSQSTHRQFKLRVIVAPASAVSALTRGTISFRPMRK